MDATVRNRSNLQKSSKPDRSTSQASGTPSNTTAASPTSTPQANMPKRKPLLVLIFLSAAFVIILWKVCHVVILCTGSDITTQSRGDTQPAAPSPFGGVKIDQLDFSADSDKQAAIITSFRVSILYVSSPAPINHLTAARMERLQ
jgi:hypothetical protein